MRSSRSKKRGASVRKRGDLAQSGASEADPREPEVPGWSLGWPVVDRSGDTGQRPPGDGSRCRSLRG